MEKRRTPARMTRYERARIVGARATEIANGDPPTVDCGGEMDPLRIAMMELAARRVPMAVKRLFLDGTSEEWDVNELSQHLADT